MQDLLKVKNSQVYFTWFYEVSAIVEHKFKHIYAEKTFCHEKSPHVCSPRTGRRANFSLRLVFGECEGFKVHDQKEIGIKKRQIIEQVMGKATKYATLGLTKKRVNAKKPRVLETLMASMTSKPILC